MRNATHELHRHESCRKRSNSTAGHRRGPRFALAYARLSSAESLLRSGKPGCSRFAGSITAQCRKSAEAPARSGGGTSGSGLLRFLWSPRLPEALEHLAPRTGAGTEKPGSSHCARAWSYRRQLRFDEAIVVWSTRRNTIPEIQICFTISPWYDGRDVKTRFGQLMNTLWPSIRTTKELLECLPHS